MSVNVLSGSGVFPAATNSYQRCTVLTFLGHSASLCAFFTFLVFAHFPGAASWAQGTAEADVNPEWEIVHKIERTKRNLTKGEDRVAYNETTLKFSRATKVKLMEDQMLTLQVFSAFYQPQIIVQDATGKALKLSNHLAPRDTKLQDGKKAKLRATLIEFVPPDRGVYTVTVTTEEVGQGPYWIQGAVWKPKTRAADAGTIAQASLKVVEDTSAVDKPRFGQSYRYKRTYVDPHNLNQFGRPTLQMSITALWKQEGHKYPPDPVPALDATNVNAVRDNVIYYKPIIDQKTGSVSRVQSTVFDPDRNIVVMLRVEGPYAHLLPELVEEGKKKLAEYRNRARPRKE